MSLLVASGVVAGYGAQDEILKGVDLVVDRGEVVAIIGPNGAGKSTLLKAIAGLLRLKLGSVTLEGRPIAGLPAREISRLGLAYVPQEFNIFPTLSVRENLEIGGYIARRRRGAGSRASSAASRCSPTKRAMPPARCPAASVRCWPWRWR